MSGSVLMDEYDERDDAYWLAYMDELYERDHIEETRRMYEEGMFH